LNAIFHVFQSIEDIEFFLDSNAIYYKNLSFYEIYGEKNNVEKQIKKISFYIRNKNLLEFPNIKISKKIKNFMEIQLDLAQSKISSEEIAFFSNFYEVKDIEIMHSELISRFKNSNLQIFLNYALVQKYMKYTNHFHAIKIFLAIKEEMSLDEIVNFILENDQKNLENLAYFLSSQRLLKEIKKLALLVKHEKKITNYINEEEIKYKSKEKTLMKNFIVIENIIIRKIFSMKTIFFCYILSEIKNKKSLLNLENFQESTLYKMADEQFFFRQFYFHPEVRKCWNIYSISEFIKIFFSCFEIKDYNFEEKSLDFR